LLSKLQSQRVSLFGALWARHAVQPAGQNITVLILYVSKNEAYTTATFTSSIYLLRHIPLNMKAIIAIPVLLAMVYRAWSHKSLTPAGIVAATLTGVAHAVHPWSLPFALLIIFFLAGTRVTKVCVESDEATKS
jgi:hypothetical protein